MYGWVFRFLFFFNLFSSVFVLVTEEEREEREEENDRNEVEGSDFWILV